jgi:CysZ protein
MQFFDELKRALSSYREAHHLIFQHRLYWYFLLPVIINAALFFLVMGMAYSYSSAWASAIINWLALDTTGTDTLVGGSLYYLALFAIYLAFISLYLLLFKYLVLVIIAPFLAPLSEKIEEIITGHRYPFRIGRFLWEVMRGAVLALRNAAIEIAVSVPLLILALVPIIGAITPVFFFLLESYFYGFSMMDYYNERQGLHVITSERHVYQHSGLAIGNGAVFTFLAWAPSLLSIFSFFLVNLLLRLLFLIPVLVLSIAPIYGVVAATIAIVKTEYPEKYDEFQRLERAAVR